MRSCRPRLRRASLIVIWSCQNLLMFLDVGRIAAAGKSIACNSARRTQAAAMSMALVRRAQCCTATDARFQWRRSTSCGRTLADLIDSGRRSAPGFPRGRARPARRTRPATLLRPVSAARSGCATSPSFDARWLRRSRGTAASSGRAVQSPALRQHSACSAAEQVARAVARRAAPRRPCRRAAAAAPRTDERGAVGQFDQRLGALLQPRHARRATAPALFASACSAIGRAVRQIGQGARPASSSRSASSVWRM